jgi:predicted transcriptional regulator
MDFVDALIVAKGSLTQDQLSELCGIPQRTISSHLSRRSEPRLSQIQKYERALPRLRELMRDGTALQEPAVVSGSAA